MRCHDTIIIGAGPAGLQMGYFLTQANRDYVILEAQDNAGSFFTTQPRLAAKMLCLLPATYQNTPGSFRATLLGGVRHREYYTPEDFASCRIAREICPEFVSGERVMKRYFGPA